MPPDQTEAIADVQRDIVEDFECLTDWTERYQYLIELGRSLSDFPDAERTEANRLQGCQARVWLVADQRAGRLFFRATSDATIVAGLIALLLKVYSDRTPREILENPPAFLAAVGLAEHLSPHRANGLSLMVARIRAIAAAQLAGGQGGSAPP